MNDYTEFTKHTIFAFGKYKGHSLGQVLEVDPGYLRWCWMFVPDFCVDESIKATVLATSTDYSYTYDQWDDLGEVVYGVDQMRKSQSSYILVKDLPKLAPIREPYTEIDPGKFMPYILWALIVLVWIVVPILVLGV